MFGLDFTGHWLIRSKGKSGMLVFEILYCAAPPNGKAADFNTVHDVSLHYTGRGKGGKGDAAEAAPPDAVIQEIDAQELNRVFVSRCS